MSFLNKLILALQTTAEKPAIFGVYHIICVLIVIAASVLLCKYLRDAEWKTVRRILLGTLITMVVLELCKQIAVSAFVTGDLLEWKYQWYLFPYQFCSTPIYVIPFALLLPEGRGRDAALAFLSSFALFGGLVVVLYPGDVFSSKIIINFQTMVHHGLQVAIGIYLAAYTRRRLGRRYFLGGVAVFGILLAAAIALNVAVHYALMAPDGSSPLFNMFYISPFHNCTLPLLSAIQPHLPYPVFLIVYILGFSVVALLLHLAAYGVCRLTGRLAHRA